MNEKRKEGWQGGKPSALRQATCWLENGLFVEACWLHVCSSMESSLRCFLSSQQPKSLLICVYGYMFYRLPEFPGDSYKIFTKVWAGNSEFSQTKNLQTKLSLLMVPVRGQSGGAAWPQTSSFQNLELAKALHPLPQCPLFFFKLTFIYFCVGRTMERKLIYHVVFRGQLVGIKLSLSLSVSLVPGIKFRPSGLAASVFTNWAIFPAHYPVAYIITVIKIATLVANTLSWLASSKHCGDRVYFCWFHFSLESQTWAGNRSMSRRKE